MVRIYRNTFKNSQHDLPHLIPAFTRNDKLITNTSLSQPLNTHTHTYTYIHTYHCLHSMWFRLLSQDMEVYVSMYIPVSYKF